MISSVSQSTVYPLSPLALPGSVGDRNGILPSQNDEPLLDTSKLYSNKNLPVNHQAARPEDAESLGRTNTSISTVELSEEAQQVINQLKVRDAEVRVHEQAHLAAAGGFAVGGISYVYQVGPDGRRYAVGGEVGIDTSAIAGDPEATLLKANVVQKAALAPAEPSAQDMRVASAAMQMAAKARAEIAQQTEEPEIASDSSEVSKERVEVSASENKSAKSIEINSDGAETNAMDQLDLTVADRQNFDLRLRLQQIA